MRKRLTYANVMTTIGVFLLLAGGTAIAAKQLGKKTVGAKQLKKNAVTTAKIKAKAVTKAKIADGAIDGTKLADGSVTTTKIVDGAVTGSKIAAGSTPFSQRVLQLKKSEQVPITPGAVYPIGSYTQNAGEDNQYVGAVDFEFAAGCIQPRTAVVLIMADSANPAVPMPQEIMGYGIVTGDTSTGTVRRRAEMTPFPVGGAPFFHTAPSGNTPHKFDLYLASGECGGGGSGVNLAGVTLDVIGTK
jgi:hypothetical protein